MEDEPDIVARLRGAAIGCDCVKCEAADEIERLRKERDAARREVCRLENPHHGFAEEIANERGWDCFKEGGNE